MGAGGREAQKGRDISIMMTDEHSCMTEMNSACKTIFQQLKEKKRGHGMFPAKNKT